MSANAKFNCLYCLIFVFYPINSCLNTQSTYLCSSIYNKKLAQYFKVVMIAYFGETFKMCANISYIMMTLNRYLLVGKDHAEWLFTAAKLEFKTVIRGSFLFSALINIGHGFEFQVVDDALTYTLNNVNHQENTYGYLNYYNYPYPNYGQSYLVYSIVYFVIDFVAFYVLNTSIEVMLVLRIRKELAEKRERQAKMFASASSLLNLKKKEDEDEKKERRVIVMVVLNGILNFVLRSTNLLYWFKSSVQLFVKMPAADSAFPVRGFLYLFVDIGYFCYILTFSSNFLIIYLFNAKFNEVCHFSK
jgi:hypothetical protein